jgi:hypothetical protein
MTQPQAAHKDKVANYVPRRICIVYSAKDGDRLENGAAVGRVYEREKEELDNSLDGLIDELTQLCELGREQKEKGEPLPKELLGIAPEDLDPEALRSYRERVRSSNGQQVSWLEDLRKVANRESRVSDQPWVVLAPIPNATERYRQRHTALFFYGIKESSDERWRRQDGNDPIVAALVKLLCFKHLASNGSRRIDEEGGRMVATPDWFACAGNGNITEMGPGTRPEPMTDNKSAGPGWWSFQFDKPISKEALEKKGLTLQENVDWAGRAGNLQQLINECRNSGKPSNVVVVVLDTCPPEESVKKAAGDRPNNRLLRSIALGKELYRSGEGKTHIDQENGVLQPKLRHDLLKEWVVNWRSEPAAHHKSIDHNVKDHRHRFEAADHGLFAAGIIRDIAPTAEIHLIRVLNDFGVGNVETLTKTLAALPGKFLSLPDNAATSNEKKLIVNLSLTVAIPNGIYLFQDWFPNTYRSLEDNLKINKRRQIKTWLQYKGNRGETIDLETALKKDGPSELNGHHILEFLKLLHANLALTIEALADQGVLVVAAAGNENGRRPKQLNRPEPCWPARYEYKGVFGVAAVNSGCQPSDYSNRGDVSPLDNGISIFGGNAERPASSGHSSDEANQPPPRIEVNTSDPHKVDAVKGIFSAGRLPMRGPKPGHTWLEGETPSGANSEPDNNQSGWVYWAGTSFAAPVITGIAAAYWANALAKGKDLGPEAKRNNLGPEAVIKGILDEYSVLLGSPNDPDGDLDCRTIWAYQKWESGAGVAAANAPTSATQQS